MVGSRFRRREPVIRMTDWASDLWAAAKTAGPFGNLLLLVIVFVLWRDLKTTRAALLSLTIQGLKITSSFEQRLRDSMNEPRKQPNKRRGRA